MILYHGTRRGLAWSICRWGLRPSDDGNAYLTSEIGCAWHFALLCADEIKDDPVVVVFDLPDDAPIKPLAIGPFQATEHRGAVSAGTIVEVIVS